MKNNLTDPEKLKAAQDSSGLKVAGSEGAQREDEGIGIMMVMDKDETTLQMERAAQAEEKRQQNALPAWHLKSTITGDLTALGVKESARVEVANMNGAAPTSNDDILRGLGVVGGARVDRHRQHHQPVLHVMEDVKTVVNAKADCEFHCLVFLLLW